MKNSLKITLALFVIILIVVYAMQVSKDKMDVQDAVVEVVPTGEPVFTWSYKSTGENGEIPRALVSLTANYSDGNIVTKEIETVQGGDCSAYPEPDKDIYPKSEMIICYYAGFGEYFKVVEADGKYLVKRREFGEASPDYNPPQAEFEVLAEF